MSFMTAVAEVVEGARQQHSQLAKTTSVKDLFLLKQEILNQQEILRKVFFRVVRFCDKESGRLPESLGEVIGSRGMKDIIERLTMANWSDPSDFKPFLNELKSLKRAFEARPPPPLALTYPQSVLDEVEGRSRPLDDLQIIPCPGAWGTWRAAPAGTRTRPKRCRPGAADSARPTASPAPGWSLSGPSRTGSGP